MLSVCIEKKLGRFQLNVSFEAEKETLALLGASGCGKSMTLKCVAGIEKPDRGRIELDGQVLFDAERGINLPPRARRVGYLFQQFALFPNMTVVQNIAAGVRTREGRRDAVAEKIAAFHLEGLENKRPHQLSGGQQQRVALARILANEPRLLLLDEPFSALDSYLKWQLELMLADTIAAYGGTAVFVSHNRDEVYRLCDSVCVLTEGRSEPKVAVRSLFGAPATLSACLLTGCKNFSRVRRLSGTRVEAEDWDAVLETGRPVPEDVTYLGVRAHYILPVKTPGENVLSCRVERVVEDVFSTVVMLRTPGGGEGYSLIRTEMGKADWAALGAPQELLVSIRPEDIMLLRE